MTEAASRTVCTSVRIATSGSGGGSPRTSMWIPSASIHASEAHRRHPPSVSRSARSRRCVRHRAAREFPHESLREHRSHLPPVVRRGDRRAHRADLFLDQLRDSESSASFTGLPSMLAVPSSRKGRELVPVSAMASDDARRALDAKRRDAGERKIDRRAGPGLAIARAQPRLHRLRWTAARMSVRASARCAAPSST